MNLNTVVTYAKPLALIVSELVANKTANAEAKNEADKRKGGLVDALRAYASTTHADGVNSGDASDALRLAMQASTDDEGKPVIPAGTVKNYCAALRGFHVMLGRGESIDDKSTAQATDEVASDEQKAIKAAKAEFAKLTKKWTAAQWREAVELYTPEAEVAAEDVADVKEAAAA